MGEWYPTALGGTGVVGGAGRAHDHT